MTINEIRNGDRPPADQLTEFRKTATTFLQWIDQPTRVHTLEGSPFVVDENLPEWEGGYWVSWPTDGSDPYPVSPRFVRDNMVEVF